MRVNSFTAVMAATVLQSAIAQTTSMQAVVEWFAALPTLGVESDTWRYLLLNLQDDVEDDTTGCAEAFADYKIIWDDVIAKTIDDTEY